MSAFEFYFSFYGLLLGLSVAQIANGIGHAVVVRRESRFGWLTPALAAFVLLDIASFWTIAWYSRDTVKVSQLSVYAGLFVALCYYLSAVLLFPVREKEWGNLDDHYWPNKKWVIAGVGIANAAAFGWAYGSGALKEWTLPSYLFLGLSYWAPLLVVGFSRWRWVDALCLTLLIGSYLSGTLAELVRLLR
jgi:hypothetical protein